MGKLLRETGDYLFRALNPIERRVQLGEMPDVYVGAVAPHAHLWDLHHLEAGIWAAHIVPPEREIGIVAKQQFAGRIPKSDFRDPKKLAKSLILLAIEPISASYAEIFPVKLSKDGGGERERMRYNQVSLYERGGRFSEKGGIALIYPHGENMQETDFPWDNRFRIKEGAFVLSALSGAPVLPIAVLQGKGGVLVGSGLPIYPERRLAYSDIGKPEAFPADEKRALKEKLADSYREIYRELGIV